MESYFKHKGLGDALRGAAIDVGALNFFDPCPRGALGSRFSPSRASILIIQSAIVSRDPSNRIFFFLIIIFTHLSPATSPQLARRVYLAANQIRQRVFPQPLSQCEISMNQCETKK